MFRREVSEVDLLLDYISGRPDRNLGELGERLRKPGAPAGMPYADVLESFAKIKYRVYDDSPPNPGDAAFVLDLKDILNTMAYPAKGSTIAYTVLYSEKTSDPSYRAASFVYPQLVASARQFRAWSIGYVLLAFSLTIFAASALWIMTHGAQLAANFDEAKKREAVYATNIYNQLDRAKDKTDKDLARAHDLQRFCLLRKEQGDAVTEWSPALSQSTSLRLLCNDYIYTAASQCSAMSDLATYQDNFVFRLVSPVLGSRPVRQACRFDLLADGGDGPKASVAQVGAPDAPRHPQVALDGAAQSPLKVAEAGQTQSQGRLAVQEDMRSIIALTATMINYFLPMAFGLIGALASFIRAVQDKVGNHTLSPRDKTLAPVRILLGLVAGVCVALFLTPASLATKGEIGFFTLSSSGVAFLAGYGANAFFGAIDRLIGQVFEPAAEPNRGR
jgi:hypothetical protein